MCGQIAYRRGSQGPQHMPHPPRMPNDYHVEDRIDDIASRVTIDQTRRDHLALHPEDARRLDITGGLLYTGRG